MRRAEQRSVFRRFCPVARRNYGDSPRRMGRAQRNPSTAKLAGIALYPPYKNSHRDIRNNGFSLPHVAALMRATVTKRQAFACRANQSIGSFICVSSPLAKNISLSPSGKTSLQVCAIHPDKGRIAIVTDAGLDAVDAAASGMN